MPAAPSWVSIAKDVTLVFSVVAYVLLLLGLVGSIFSPKLKQIKRILVTVGVALLVACFLAGGIAGFLAYEMARRYADGAL
jgi:hypothetical protein